MVTVNINAGFSTIGELRSGALVGVNSLVGVSG